MWMNRPGWLVHKRAFVTLGHNSLSSACLGVGHKGIAQSAPVGRRALPDTYGYVRFSRPRVSELSGSDPETQRQQLLAVGVALSHIYQDVGVSGTSGTNSRRGWHSLDSRLAQGDTLVVVSIDRIGRRWLDTMGNIHDLQRRGVRIRSLADNERYWAQYLDADPDSPESFLGYTLAGFAAWVSDQELVSIRRRTKAGLAKAKADGKRLALPAGCQRSRRPRPSRW